MRVYRTNAGGTHETPGGYAAHSQRTMARTQRSLAIDCQQQWEQVWPGSRPLIMTALVMGSQLRNHGKTANDDM